MIATAVLETGAESSEIYSLLKLELGRRLGSQSVDAWVSHLLRITPEDVEVRRSAAQALLRRVAAAKDLEGELTRKGAGRYSFKSEMGTTYQLRFYADSPVPMTCTCPDFSRSSLGVCKHLWRTLQLEPNGTGTTPSPDLIWLPVRAWQGPAPLFSNFRWRQPHTERRAGWVESDLPGYVKLADSAAPASVVESLEAALTKTTSVDPVAEAIYRELHGTLVTPAKPSSSTAGRFAHLRRALFPYQREGVERFLSQERLLLGDDMGLGKTTQAIAAATILLREGKVRRALVICPASLKSQWAREWLEATGEEVTVVEGSPDERRRLYRQKTSGVMLMNYEQVVRDIAYVSRWKAELVVLDEAQRLKNWATKTALTVKTLMPRYRLVLTGTPFENRLDELASLVEWVEDRALEPKWRLSCFHSVRADGRHHVIAARNLDTLRARLAHCFLRRTKADVLAQLPERTDTRVSVPMTEAQRESHDSLSKPIAEILGRRKRRPLSQAEFLKLMTLFSEQRMISNALVLPNHDDFWPDLSRESAEKRLSLLGSPKLEEFRELVAQLAVAQGQKIVVFSQWRRMLEWAEWCVRDVLREEGLEAAFFTGQESQRRRTENLVRFQDDPSVRLLFLTDAGGVGLNLQRSASVLVNLEYPWNPAVLEQRIGRVHRHGQSKAVQVYLLGSEDGIEARIAALVGDKKAFFKGLFDGGSDTVHFDKSGSFMENLEKLLPESEQVSPNAKAKEEEIVLDEVTDVPSETVSPVVEVQEPAPVAAVTSPGDWLRQVRIERTPTGGLKLEADGHAAQQLASVFSGLANLFASVPVQESAQAGVVERPRKAPETRA